MIEVKYVTECCKKPITVNNKGFPFNCYSQVMTKCANCEGKETRVLWLKNNMMTKPSRQDIKSQCNTCMKGHKEKIEFNKESTETAFKHILRDEVLSLMNTPKNVDMLLDYLKQLLKGTYTDTEIYKIILYDIQVNISNINLEQCYQQIKRWCSDDIRKFPMREFRVWYNNLLDQKIDNVLFEKKQELKNELMKYEQ